MMPLLRVAGLQKSFAAPVLRDLDFTLAAGEVHALVGGNGAGKSTFANILAGLLRPDGGRIELEGNAYAPTDRSSAQRLGVTLMLQELHLLPTLSIAENLFLNNLPSRAGFVSRKRLKEQAAEALARVGLEKLDPMGSPGDLGIGTQQLVVLAGALAQDCKVIILDEPTAALTAGETEILFHHVRRLRAAGKAILYISHRMEELREIADTVSVLRDGLRVATLPMAETDSDQLIQMMTGRDLARSSGKSRRVSEQIALRVTKLRAAPLVEDVSFEVREGEIFGLSGLVGAGRTETLRAIFGADRREQGRVEIGKPLRETKISSPKDAVKAGLALIPEDRKRDGLLMPLGMRVNASLATLTGLLTSRSESRDTEQMRERLDVRCNSIEQAVGNLSGGNQQKVVLARWLLGNMSVFLLDEPTRGVDAAAKELIYEILRELAAEGKALVVVSSDVQELMTICDRIAVMSGGRIVEEFSPGEWSAEKLGEAAFRSHLRKTPRTP